MQGITNVNTSKSQIRYFLEENHSFPAVALGVFVRSGSRYEGDKLGIAHFIEHMVFKETKNRSAFEVSSAIESLGGEINAYTSFEHSTFYVKLLSKDIERGFEILSDILINPTFNSVLLEKERQVILEEIFEYYDDPQDICQTEAVKSVFGNHPVSRNPLGSEESLKAITKEDLENYFNKFFVKDNIFISVVGDISKETFLDLLEKYFGDFKEGRVNIIDDSPSYNFSELVIPKDTTQLHLAITLKGEKSFTHESYVHAIFTTALGGNMSSRLFQKLREENGFVYTVYAYPVRFVDTGATVIYASTLPKYGSTVKSMILEELENLKQKGLSDKEFTDSKNFLLGNLILGLESSSSRMQKNGVSGLLQGYVKNVDAIIKEVQSISKDEVNAYLSKWIDGNYGVVKVGAIGG